MVTVAVDATPLLGAHTGVATLVAGFLSELSRRSHLDLRAYALSARKAGQLGPALPSAVTALPLPLPAAALLRLWARTDHPRIEWATGAVDVVHGTNFVVPPTRRAARLVTVHDLTCIRFPELCSPVALRYPALIARAIAGGATVHVTSQAIAEEVIEHFDVDADRLVVIAPGVRGSVPPPPTAERGEPAGPRYILALGTVEPRKDLPSLVRAFDLVAAIDPEIELRIAGPSGWGDGQLATATAAAVHRNRIKRIGWVMDRDSLLAGATVFAYPSLYEGFGFPPLEAMTHGVPVVATSVGALREVLGDAALLVSVGDVEGLAAALLGVVNDSELRSGLVRAGLERAAFFSWEKAGAAMADLYGDLAGGF